MIRGGLCGGNGVEWGRLRLRSSTPLTKPGVCVENALPDGTWPGSLRILFNINPIDLGRSFTSSDKQS